MAASMAATVTAIISGNSSATPKDLANDISKKNEKFLEFIENLGEHLTNTDTVTRGRATRLIGDVIAFLPPSFLAKKQVEVLFPFLLSKLADHHSVQPHALQSLATLTSRCSPLLEGLSEQICCTIFREIQNQTLSQSDRRATYTILQNVLAADRKAVEKMGGDFVIGFIQQMDSEKDPRNLMIVFSCAQFICSNLSLGAFTEEMFEVLGCYFPVDFTPPPGDSHGVTREELSAALRNCLSSCPDFAPFCMPLLLEKMTSDLQPARLEAFITLNQCAPIYGRRGLTEFLRSITSSVKREVLMNISGELVTAAKQSIRAVYTSMTPAEGVNIAKDDIMTASIVELYQDIMKYLEGPDMNKSCLAFSLCLAIASSSPLAFSTITPLVLPSLIKSCKEQNQTPAQLLYLKELSGFLRVCKEFHANKSVVESLSPHSSELFDLYQSLMDALPVDAQLESLLGLSLLASELALITADQLVVFLEILAKKAVSVTDGTLRKEVLSSINELIKGHPDLRRKMIDFLKSLVSNASDPAQMLIYEALTYTAHDEPSFSEVNSFLQSIISQSHTDDVLSPLNGLLLMVKRLSSVVSCMSTITDKVALPLLRAAVTLCRQWTKDSQVKSEDVLAVFRDVFKAVGASMEKSNTTDLWNKLQALMLEGKVNSIGLSGDVKDIRPLQSDSPWQESRLVCLLEGFLLGADMQALVENRELVFETVFVLALNCEDEFTHTSACRCVAAFMNKAPIGSQIHWLLEPVMEKLKTAMSGSDPGGLRAVRIWTWITKALECRGHSACGIFSSHLVSLLSDKHLGAEAAQGLGLVVRDMEEVFSPGLKSTVTPLYKQRFFSLNLRAFLEGYSSASSVIKQNYLTSLSSMMANLPLPVLKPYLPQLVPLLLQSLCQSDQAMHKEALTTLSNAVSCAPEVIVSSLDSLIPRLLELAKNERLLGVRQSALKCLESVSSLPSHTVVPHQEQVVRELASMLDDKKRLVRKQAVETRWSWILMEKAKA